MVMLLSIRKSVKLSAFQIKLVWRLSILNILEEDHFYVDRIYNNKDVCRTAPASPGVSKIACYPCRW